MTQTADVIGIIEAEFKEKIQVHLGQLGMATIQAN
jgi:hypothetical protein